MNRIHFYIIFIFFVITSCKSNYTRIGDRNANYIPYYLKVYEADSLYLVGDYKSSYKILDSLFKHYEPINMPIYSEYEQYIKLSYSLNKKTKKELRNLSKYYNYSIDDIKQDSILYLVLGKSKISEKKITKWHNQFEKKIDTIYRNLIHRMNLKDQMIRKNVDVNWDNVKKVDLENDSILKLKLSLLGFPNIKKVGNYKKMTSEISTKDVSLDVILIHLSVDNNIFESYKKILFEYVKKGYLPPKTYANVVDKNYYINNKNSYYHFMFSNFNYSEMDEIIRNEINIKRKSAGLPCIDYDSLFIKKRIFNN